MIYIKDNFLEKSVLKKVKKHINDVGFTETKGGDKVFYVQPSTKEFDELVFDKLEEIHQRPLENILSFFRTSTDKLDDEWRIHVDAITNYNGVHDTDRATLLYLSDSTLEELHGTAFWEHHVHGQTFSPTIKDPQSLKEHDRIINEERNDLSKFTLKSVVGWNPNRLIDFPGNLFHSKYPNKSWESGRELYVAFYKFKN